MRDPQIQYTHKPEAARPINMSAFLYYDEHGNPMDMWNIKLNVNITFPYQHVDALLRRYFQVGTPAGVAAPAYTTHITNTEYTAWIQPQNKYYLPGGAALPLWHQTRFHGVIPEAGLQALIERVPNNREFTHEDVDYQLYEVGVNIGLSYNRRTGDQNGYDSKDNNAHIEIKYADPANTNRRVCVNVHFKKPLPTPAGTPAVTPLAAVMAAVAELDTLVQSLRNVDEVNEFTHAKAVTLENYDTQRYGVAKASAPYQALVYGLRSKAQVTLLEDRLNQEVSEHNATKNALAEIKDELAESKIRQDSLASVVEKLTSEVEELKAVLTRRTEEVESSASSSSSPGIFN